MHEAVDDVIARRRADPDGLKRALSTSMAIHFGLVFLLLVIPKSFWAKAQPTPLLMTISFSGSGGNQSGGMVAAGARPVEQVAPPPKRPEPIPPATPPKATAVTVSVKPATKPTPAPTPTATPSSVARTPTTGAEVRPGTSLAETGSKTQSTGLTFGGQQPGDMAVSVDTTFCCPDYIEELKRRVLVAWRRDQPDAGSVTVVFEIQKDGSFSAPHVEKSTGPVTLDIASLDAFKNLRLLPLPKEYKEERLKIHMVFPYVR